jgi:hypothetical protein
LSEVLAAERASRAGSAVRQRLRDADVVDQRFIVERMARPPPCTEASVSVSKARAISMAPTKAKTTSVHHLKVTLAYLEPPIWRRLAVPSHFTLGRLHLIIQWAMGWESSHLHAFQVGGKVYGDDPESPDESKVMVGGALPKKGAKAVYIYDFGDDWRHEITVEQVGTPDPKATYPTCIDGQRACPPEDCGGPPGYERLLEILGDPDHEEHDEMKDWLGKKFDAERFDIARANRELKKIR